MTLDEFFDAHVCHGGAGVAFVINPISGGNGDVSWYVCEMSKPVKSYGGGETPSAAIHKAIEHLQQ